MNSVNKNCRIDLIKVKSTDDKELTKVQTKLNQWITTGILIKYQIHIAGDYIVFNICRFKASGE